MNSLLRTSPFLLLLVLLPALMAAVAPAGVQSWPRPTTLRHRTLPRPQQHTVSGRITGGQQATRGQFKYQVAVMVDGSVLCGGVLISDRVVATVAQCAKGYTRFQLHLGAQQFYNNGEAGRLIIDSQVVRVHEGYVASNFNNDIALVWLPSAVANSQYVQPIKMASPSDGDFTGYQGTIAGWGTLFDGSYAISNELRFTTVSVISNDECIATYGSQVVTSGVVCKSGADYGSPCLGDSGTALAVTGSDGQPLLIGVASFISTRAGCEGGDPSGFVRISAYRDWIAANSP